MFIQVHIYIKKGSKVVQRRVVGETLRKRKIMATLASANFQKAYVYVGYGKKLDNHGNLVKFENFGEYTDPAEAKQAFEAFVEE